jgi:hypothetical protein
MAKIDRAKLLEYLDIEMDEQLNLAALIRYCMIDEPSRDLTNRKIPRK